MADYYGKCRSNYFAVKDRSTFEQFCERLSLELITDTDSTTQREYVGFMSDSGIPTEVENEETEEWDEVDFLQELAKHLKDGEVAIVMEVGSEKMRYLNGFACAVNSKGETTQVSLNDIYEDANQLGTHVSDCTY